jgi:hypothetical protein
LAWIKDVGTGGDIRQRNGVLLLFFLLETGRTRGKKVVAT